jgi:hypothetical protein
MLIMGKFGRLAKFILDVAAEELEAGAACLKYQGLYADEGYSGVHGKVLADRRRRFRDQLRKMKERKLIRLKKDGEAMIIDLTAKGLEKRLKILIGRKKAVPGEPSTIIIYDIPEHLHRSRDELRRFLRSVGFERIQRSVWVIEKDVALLMRSWIDGKRWKRWIVVFTGNIS